MRFFYVYLTSSKIPAAAIWMSSFFFLFLQFMYFLEFL